MQDYLGRRESQAHGPSGVAGPRFEGLWKLIGRARGLIGASSGPDWTAIGPATGLARARVMRDWRSILLLEQAVVLISRNIAGDAVDLLVDRPALPIT